MIGPRLSPRRKANQEWQAPYGTTHDEVDMSLMGADVCSHCAQDSKGWGFLPSMSMDEGFNNGGMD